LTTIDTKISWGFLSLLEVFAKANNLEVNFIARDSGLGKQVSITYDENSDTALSITMLAMKHAGFLNMLDDFLIRCGIDSRFISTGSGGGPKKSDEQMEKDWQEHRKKIGLR
jgi:hypothetical protein